MSRKLVALLSLPAQDRLLLGEIWLRLLVAYLALRRWPLQQAARALDALPCLPLPGPVAPDRLACLADVAARHHVRPVHCLERCLALQGLLRRQGIGTELRIGACRFEDQVLFHAWLEDGGLPVGENPAILDHFQPLSFPSELANALPG